jgi:glycosyltransferase involved in cell wall biosynthesis
VPTVLHVIDSLGAGGAERSLAELLPRYRDAGFHSVVVCLKRRPDGVEDEVRAGGFDLRFIEPTAFVRQVTAVRRIIGDVHPDLVHTTLVRSNLVGRLASIRRSPVLSSVVNTSYAPSRTKLRTTRRAPLRVVRMLDRWSARRLTVHLHTISNTVADEATELLGVPRSKITVVPRGRGATRVGEITPERRASARALLDLAADDEVVLAVARHDFQKGLGHLLEAALLLRADRPKLRVLIAGRTGAATASLQPALDRLGPAGRALGFRDDVTDVLAAADVFAFPSLWEGQGGALVEALAIGLPIVASDLPVLREVVDDDEQALLVPVADPPALAAAISRLLDDPALRARLSSAAQCRYRERYTLERSAEGMVALYRRLTDG